MPLDFVPAKLEKRKITMMLPADLVDSIKRDSKLNFSETVETALREMRHRQACQELLKLRGKVKFHMSWQELRAMDDE